MFASQCEWLCDQNGQLLVDKVYRFEALSEVFEDLKKQLKLESELPHLKPNKRGGYQTYYDDKTQATIAKCFAQDIERFAYAF